MYYSVVQTPTPSGSLQKTSLVCTSSFQRRKPVSFRYGATSEACCQHKKISLLYRKLHHVERERQKNLHDVESFLLQSNKCGKLPVLPLLNPCTLGTSLSSGPSLATAVLN